MAIKVLSKEITQKISAGEVVERPASIVKELIENSIDAGATNITIEIENGGISYIRVTDNGCGMDSIDSIECFKTHATSKISEETDLYKIATLGFRGEAIPSISAVSRVTLYTRTSGSEFGMKVINHGGDLIEQEKSGRPEGTTIIVEDVFYNVPARLKFLKKPSAEMAHISSIVQKYILARPDIAFRFISNKKDVFISSGDNNLKNAIRVIYGNEIYSKLIPLTYEYGDIKINGFIGDPEIARATKTMQNLFVNSRYVKSDMISNSIKQGYLNRLMFAKHPFFVVNLYLSFSDIDVNVHPNKLEVRFKEEGIIQECFFKAVKSAFENLKHSEDVPFYETEKPKIIEVKPVEPHNRAEVKQSLMDIVNSHIISEPKTESVNEAAAQSFNVQRMFDEVAEEKAEKETALEQKTVIVDTKANVERNEKPQSELQLTLSEDIGEYNIIGQLFNTYILVEYKESFLLIDQHAAHERLNTNRLLKEVEESRVEKQILLMPFVLKLTPEDFGTAFENAETFNELGFEIEEFGDSTIRVNTVPQLFGEGNLQSFFMDTLDAIKNNPKLDARKDKIFQNACKHSIKAGDKLSNEQIKELIKESMEDNSPLNCPHGRSIVLVKTKREIEKWFNRIV